jgi:AraC family transcriptional regulator of adaptative response / DNA-3-methyladenine glycosylase II
LFATGQGLTRKAAGQCCTEPETGALDGDGVTVEQFATRLGIGARHLARLFAQLAGANPMQVAGTARLQRAKRLLDSTDLPMPEIAARAGFGSLRRFNAAFAELYGRTPTAIRGRGSTLTGDRSIRSKPLRAAHTS